MAPPVIYNASDERGEAIGACPPPIMYCERWEGRRKRCIAPPMIQCEGCGRWRKGVHRPIDDITRAMRQMEKEVQAQPIVVIGRGPPNSSYARITKRYPLLSENIIIRTRLKFQRFEIEGVLLDSVRP